MVVVKGSLVVAPMVVVGVANGSKSYYHYGSKQ